MARVSWSDAWRTALYEPGRGFYHTHRSDRHFATAVAGIPGTTPLLARALTALMDRIGATTFVDVGCGGGQLLGHVHRLRPGSRVVGVELADRPATLPAGVDWLTSPAEPAGLPSDVTGLTDCLLVAHEWLDALPCPVLQLDARGDPREVLVDPVDGSEDLGATPRPQDLDWCPTHWPPRDLPPGARIEVGRPRNRAWADLVGRVRSGLVLAIDYGHDRRNRPPGGTLSGYRRGRRVAPVPDGTCDLTAHVAVDSLASDRVVDQRRALASLGLDDTRPGPNARTDPRGYLACLQDTAAAAALRDPAGLGAFQWILALRRPRPRSRCAALGCASVAPPSAAPGTADAAPPRATYTRVMPDSTPTTASGTTVVLSVGSLGDVVAARPGTPPTVLPLGLGPDHPSSHGLMQLALVLEGDVIVSAEPRVGFLHRGAEKLFEVRDYRQIAALASRHDWLTTIGGELGVVLVVENALGIEVPARATWLRTLLAEIGRIGHHLAFLGCFPSAAKHPWPGPLRAPREELLDLVEQAGGSRIHPALTRVGGLLRDVPAGWFDAVEAVVGDLARAWPTVMARLDSDPDVNRRTRGVGVLTPRLAEGYGVSGPVARACGVDLDLRRDEGYLAYPELFDGAGPGRVVTRDEGDTWARLAVLAEQVSVSLTLVASCLDRLRSMPPGPIGVRVPAVVRAPEGDWYAATENPGGINGYYLVSRAAATPWRMKIRAASFNNVAALGALLPGSRLEELTTILASLCYLVGDIDR